MDKIVASLHRKPQQPQLISDMSDARMRKGIRTPDWHPLLVEILGIISKCESLQDLKRFAGRHHAAPTEALGVELKRPPSDSAFRYFFL